MIAAITDNGAWPLVIVLVLALLVAIVAVWLIVRARKAPVVRKPVAAAADAKQSLWHKLGDAMSELVRTVRYISMRREWRYQMPWIFLIGERGAGRTSIANSLCNRREHISAREEKLAIAGTRWWFYDRGVLIDVDGAGLPSTTGDDHRWKDILRGMVDQRPERALDGVVLAVSARTLLKGSSADVQRLVERCQAQLRDMHDYFEFAVPVYVVVTQCDVVEGFGAFWKAQPEKRRREIFGWSNPYALENSFVPEWLDDAFDQMRLSLKLLQLQAAASDRDIEQADDFFLLPQRFHQLHQPLYALLAPLFRARGFEATSFFRGVYFTGAVAADGALAPQTLSTVAFIDQLFSEKVFAELHLARPLRDALWSRHRLIRRLQYGAAALFAVMLLSLAHAGWRLQHQVDVSVASINLIQNPQHLSREGGGCVDKKTVYELLANISLMDVSLVYLTIPASWVDRRISDRGMQLIADAAFEELVFPSLACHLEHRARMLIRNDIVPSNSPDALTSDRERLHEYLDAVLSFERSLARFNRLVVYSARDRSDELLDDLDALAAYAYGESLPPVVYNKRGQHRDALTHVEYRRALVLPTGMRSLIGTKVTGMLEHVRQEIDREIDAGAMLLETLNHEQTAIFANVQRFDRWLAHIRNDWLTATEQVNPCRKTAEAIDTKISELQGKHGYTREMLALSNAFDRTSCYEPALRRLAELRVAPHGVLFRREQGRLVLAPAVAAEADGFRAMAKLDFMQLAPRQPFACRLPLRGWRGSDLGEASTFIRQYQEFLRVQNLETSGTATALYLRLIQRQLRAVLDETMHRAQMRVGQADTSRTTSVDAISTADQEMEQQAGDFNRTLEPLLWVLRMYRQLGFDASHVKIAQCARHHAAQSLQSLHVLTDMSHLYEPVADLTSADGDQPRALFVLGGGPQVKEYLDRQLQRAQVLASHASPFVTFLKNMEGVNDAADTPQGSGAYWENTIQEMNRFVQFKVPNAQVALLHDLFTKQLGPMTSENCDQLIADYVPEALGNDLFSRKRQGLERRAQMHCFDRNRAIAYANYQTLARQFAGELSGRFPFGFVDSNDASVASVRSFFDAYAKQRDPVRARLGRLKGEGWSEIGTFLDQIEQAAGFFGPNLAADAIQPIRLRVEFRSMARTSVGAENIVSWRVVTPNGAASHPNGKTEIEWRVGQPISLELVWADLASVVPQTDTRQSDMRVDRHTVTFDADGPWALLKLMRRHLPQAAPRVDPSDPSLALLEFRIPTRDKRAPESAASTEARVYLGIKFYAIDPKTQTAVAMKPLQGFPVHAPTVW